MPPAADAQALGLRERKKAKTRAAIQRHALRLFRDQGYEATTVNQIAEAAEISESTFFRYFPSKEAAVLWDDLDPLLLEAFRGQPPDAQPVAAFRAAIRSVFDGLTAAEQSEQLERWLLIQSAPELRSAALDQLFDGILQVGELVAERAGRSSGDIGVRALAGAVIGVIMAVLLDPEADLVEATDAALAQLEAGFPL